MPDTDPTPPETPLAKLEPISPLEIIREIIANPDIDVVKIEAIVALQERMTAAAAKTAWTNAMAQFQAACPLIVKTQAADRYNFASHAFIMERIKPLLATWGLSLSFSQEQLQDGRLHATCYIAHGAHTETRHFTCPVPKVPGANETQCMGAGYAYAMKYVLVGALGLSVGGMDCDGAPKPNPAPAADPNAPQAPARDDREKPPDPDAAAAFERWKAAGGGNKPGFSFWDFVATCLAVSREEVGKMTMTAAEWDKVTVVLGEMKEVENA